MTKPLLCFRVLVTELREGTFVRVSGAIRDFDIIEIETELDADLDADLLARFNDQPAVIAAVVTIGVSSVDDLLENVGVFLDQTVGVTGKVAEVVGPGVFSLEADEVDGSLLVVAPDAAAAEDLTTGV